MINETKEQLQKLMTLNDRIQLLKSDMLIFLNKKLEEFSLSKVEIIIKNLLEFENDASEF